MYHIYSAISGKFGCWVKAEAGDLMDVWHSVMYRKTSEEFRKLLGVEPITTVI